MNVTELGRRLKIHDKERLFKIINELGFNIGKKAIKIDDRVANRIISLYQERQRGQKKEKERIEIIEEAKKIAKEKKEIDIPPKITVKGLSEKVSLPVTEVIKILMQNGIMASINENIDAETACIIAEDLGYKACLSEGEELVKNDQEKIEKIKNLLDKEKDTTERPPVVVVMGHVDHGKTKLLDAIRKTNVVDEEAGGITQHIGAYQVEEAGRLVTFIDTPGHEAFTAMRSRGANVADLAILVIAADDGIKPQTVEAIEIMEKVGLPFLVAINKIDKPGADIEKVKKELSELNLVPEEWGGKTICVEISAKKLLHIDKLLEMVLLLADIEKENIQANPEGRTAGTIIEANIDKGEGPVATIIVQNGTLKIGDLVMVGGVPGKIKSLRDWQGKAVKQAGPSMPVRILGLKSAPTVGDILEESDDKKDFKKASKKLKTFTTSQPERTTEEENDEEKKDIKKLNLVIKADTLGSLEAIIASLNDLTTTDLEIDIIHQGLGNVTEKDITQAEATGAYVLGFSVKEAPNVIELASKAKVEIKLYKIIYELIDFVKEELEKLLEPETVHEKIGELKVLAIFRTNPTWQIIGGKVTKGTVINEASVKIKRKDEETGAGKITELQQDKKKINKVGKGIECGLSLETQTAIEEGDILEIFEVKTEKKKL